MQAPPPPPAEERGGFGGRGRGGFGRGRGRGGRGGRGGGRGMDEKKEWVPCTKLGRLVKEGRLNTLEEIFLFSMPLREYQIVDTFLKEGTLKDEMLYCCQVQKQSAAGQRNRHKVFIICGDNNGHVGIGARTAKDVSSAIRASTIFAKLSVIPVRRGYWGNMIGKPHTVPMKVSGKRGSVSVRLIPAPRGTGIVAAPVPTKILQYAGIEDCYTSSVGSTKTRGNFIMATFAALRKTYGFLTPDLWASTNAGRDPHDEHSEFLASKPLGTEANFTA